MSTILLNLLFSKKMQALVTFIEALLTTLYYSFLYNLCTQKHRDSF